MSRYSSQILICIIKTMAKFQQLSHGCLITLVTEIGMICNEWDLCQELLDFQEASLQWRHNGRDGVWNHQPHECLLTSLAFVRGIHQWIPRTKGQWRGKCVYLMMSSCNGHVWLFWTVCSSAQLTRHTCRHASWKSCRLSESRYMAGFHNTLTTEYNFQLHFVHENIWISKKISLECVHGCLIHNILPGNVLASEGWTLTDMHICIFICFPILKMPQCLDAC